MKPSFFRNQSRFRAWLHKNHDSVEELWVGYYKKVTGIPSITWSGSVDEALCYGWIDGLRKSIDERSYQIRFTPRKPGSRWSDINVRRVKELKKLGKIEPAGLRAFEKRKQSQTTYALKSGDIKFSRQFEETLQSNEKAWRYFNTLTSSVRKMCIAWVMDAKKEETRHRRLKVLIESSEKGQKIPPLIVSTKACQPSCTS
jgi:uncharacterized protein YdeI (YjbR/CyaY-like superfamily)